MTRRFLGLAWLIVGLFVLLGFVGATWVVERVLLVLGVGPTGRAAAWFTLGTGALAGSLGVLSSRRLKDRIQELPRLRQ